MTPTCYIASRFRNKQRVRDLTALLADAGITAIQTWTEEPPGQNSAIAVSRDLLEIDAADFIIVLTLDCDSVPGGMHFEAGYAYAKGKKMTLIGRPVNIFLTLAAAVFDDVESFMHTVKAC